MMINSIANKWIRCLSSLSSTTVYTVYNWTYVLYFYISAGVVGFFTPEKMSTVLHYHTAPQHHPAIFQPRYNPGGPSSSAVIQT